MQPRRRRAVSILVSAKAMLCAMIAGTGLCLLVAARQSEPVREPHVQPRPHERPWLTHQADAQIVGPNGTLGPLFDGVVLGGSTPLPEVRARIAAFARAHGVDIELEMHDGEVAAVRFTVSFGGCCGYEGVDTLAARLHRPHTGTCCVCGGDTWIDDWIVVPEEGIQARGRIRVNRLTVRWERAATVPELVERADAMLGQAPSALHEVAGDRWRELEPGHYAVEVAHPSLRYSEWFVTAPMRESQELGIDLVGEHGRIAQVGFSLRDLDHDALAELRKTLRVRWGRPQTKGQTLTWRTVDRTITADLDANPAQVTIHTR